MPTTRTDDILQDTSLAKQNRMHSAQQSQHLQPMNPNVPPQNNKQQRQHHSQHQRQQSGESRNVNRDTGTTMVASGHPTPYIGTGGLSPGKQGFSSDVNPPITASGLPPPKPFPHAFERWEMLSSRWEGLTGYWISKLEQNKYELENLPLEQQMSRQIADLSSAGANLFHAVVELQRLRASSERKFQRWFFETRADQERIREITSELEATLRMERQKRAEAAARAVEAENARKTAEKLVEEMRRELQISREECRRSWEELGRREQEERERINNLRSGHPALVGDVQVFPVMMQPSDQGSAPQSAVGTNSQLGPNQEYIGSEVSMDQPILGPSTHTTPDPSQVYYPPGHHPHQQQQQQQQQQYAYAQQTRNTGAPSQAPGLPPQNQPLHTPTANPDTYMHHSPDDDSELSAAPGQDEHADWGKYDGYDGQGYSEAVPTYRHHHPTRLSDVQEEDTQTERSG